MKPEACLEVAKSSRKQAEAYLQKGNAGRAFAHFLVALKLCPCWKVELTHHFTSALCSWGEKLEGQQRYKDLFSCYEQALEVLPDSEELLNNLGAHLYRWGHVTEACSYFQRAIKCNPGFLPARRNLQGSYNLLVERWHFRMLNDSIRNDAYRAAITRRVLQQGPGSSVLDIGTGTGVLSLFAAEAGAGQVFACDCSSTMIQIASDVMRANGASGKVNLINKLSTDIIIPTDMPARVSLVVTETVDSGLLGEGILQSLIHAWDLLLLPAGCRDQEANPGRVVPEAAGVWIVPIECLHIARKNWLLKPETTQEDFLNHLQVQTDTFSRDPEVQKVHSNRTVLDLSKLELTARRDEPYDTEDLNTVPDGYSFLASPCHAVHFKFSDCQEMVEWLRGQKHVEHCITCTQPGRVDAVAMWFDLHLDDVTTISSAPDDGSDRDGVHRANCWDQAIFPVRSPIHVTSGQKLNISITCRGGKVSVDVHDQHKNEVAQAMSKLQDAFSCGKIFVVQDDSHPSREFRNDDQKSSENDSNTADSDPEYSGNLSLNIPANWKKGTSHIDCTAHEEEKVIVLKDMHRKYEMILKEAEFNTSDNSNVLRSVEHSKKILHKIPDPDVCCGITRRLGCSGVASQEVVRFLNNKQWLESLQKTAVLLCQQRSDIRISAVLDLSPFPVLGLHVLTSCAASLMCVVSSLEDELAIKKVAELSGISMTQLQCVTEKQLLDVLDSGKVFFDVIVAHLVDPSGELKETAFNMIPALSSSLAEGGIILPQHISVIGQLLESDWLVQVSRVQNLRTCGYDIARFINEYQVTQHLDLNLSTLTTTILSKPIELLHLSLERCCYQTTQITSTAATHSGMMNAVAYWYSICFHEDTPAVCTTNPDSHVNQAAILLQPSVSVCDGQIVKFLLRFHYGLIQVEPLHGDEDSS